MRGLLKKIFIPFDLLFDRGSAAAGALLFSQIPLFIAHYVQRLGGHVDELARVVGKYRSAALENGKGLEEYIAKFVNSSDIDFVSAGKNMKLNIDRLADLKGALEQLTSSGPFKKLLYFIRDIDLEIARAAAKNFSFGISFTMEGLIYAVCGLVAGSLVYIGIKKLFAMICNRIFKSSPNPLQ